MLCEQLIKSLLGGDLSTFMARNTGTNMALQSGRDGETKNQVPEHGAKSEVLQPSARCWAVAEDCGRCGGPWWGR